MTYVSPAFLLLLCVGIALSWLFPGRRQAIGIMAGGILFLGWFSPVSLALLVGTTGFTWFLCGRRPPRGAELACLALGLGVLFVFLKQRAGLANGGDGMPLGLAYYLFRQIHYGVEAWKGSLRPHSFTEFCSYLLLLPQLPTGPIHLFPDFLHDLRARRRDWPLFSLGLERAFHGFAKLIILANYLVSTVLASWLLVMKGQISGHSMLILQSTLQWLDLYLRFSACSDIAIGAGAMMGFRIIENFDSPFLARNITDFWNRWHLSLTGWCREYVYKPVAAVTRSHGLSLGMTMVVIGLWHELSLRYLLWGAYHSLGMIIHRRYRHWRGPVVADPEPFADGACARIRRLVERGLATGLTLGFVVSSFPVTTWAQDSLLKLAGWR